jgi:hypothetical protein
MYIGMERKSLNDLSKTEQIRLYLNDNPECLTERLMVEVAARYMNYGYIRLRIKQMYPDIIYENIMYNNFVRIPDHYNEQE